MQFWRVGPVSSRGSGFSVHPIFVRFLQLFWQISQTISKCYLLIIKYLEIQQLNHRVNQNCASLNEPGTTMGTLLSDLLGTILPF